MRSKLISLKRVLRWDARNELNQSEAEIEHPTSEYKKAVLLQSSEGETDDLARTVRCNDGPLLR